MVCKTLAFEASPFNPLPYALFSKQCTCADCLILTQLCAQSITEYHKVKLKCMSARLVFPLKGLKECSSVKRVSLRFFGGFRFKFSSKKNINVIETCIKVRNNLICCFCKYNPPKNKKNALHYITPLNIPSLRRKKCLEPLTPQKINSIDCRKSRYFSSIRDQSIRCTDRSGRKLSRKYYEVEYDRWNSFLIQKYYR